MNLSSGNVVGLEISEYWYIVADFGKLTARKSVRAECLVDC
jgi:hypothetical protein